MQLSAQLQAMKSYVEDDSVRIGRAASVSAAAAIQEYVRLLTAAAANNARASGDSVLRASHVNAAARDLDI
jgi:hypothetical protein